MSFKNKQVLKFTTLLMAMLMIAMVILPASQVFAAPATDAYTAKAEELVQNIYDKYMENGKVALSSNTELDGFAIYVLNKAKINVLDWEFEGVTVEEELDALIANAIIKEADGTEEINAKQLAFLYVAAASSNKTAEAAQLLDFLKTRQSATENGGFVDGDYSEYTNLPVFDLLAAEGKLNILEKADKAFDYIKALNPTEAEYPDLMSISQTGRILKGFKVQLAKTGVDELIQSIVQWQKENLQEDGSFNAGGGDAVTNTAEVLWTIKSLENSDTLTVEDRDNALNYLVEKATFANIGSNAWALRALSLNGAEPKFTIKVEDKEDAEVISEVAVDVAVIDNNGKVIYGPKSITLKHDDEFGLTGLSALVKTGLDYNIDTNNDFVTAIEKIENEGLSGWMYGVNGTAPAVPAIEKTLADGDQVLWYYSTSSTAGVPSFPVATVSFTDVGADVAWAKEAIEALAGKGIITGTGNNKFEPKRQITRAEFAKMVVETLGENIVSQGTDMFTDVDSTAWYADYVGKAAAKGLIQGSNGKYRPNDVITRNEVAVILHRMQNEVAPTNLVLGFKDGASVPAWANNAVAFAVEKGLVNGYEDNTFKGNNPITRAEAALVLYRYMGL